MKRLYKFTLTIVLLFLGTLPIFSQSPQGINYQAVIRDNSGAALDGESVSVRFTIHQTTASGVAVFQEIHAATTNQFGLVNLVIGSVNTTAFPLINWSTGIYFLQIEVDAGAGFDDLGATQLMSVPYALYAETSGTGAQGLNSLLDTSTVSLVTCPNGGKRVVMGLDANSNGVLDAVEVTSSFVLCNGADGLSINWLGTNQPTTPSANDAYYNSVDGVSYIYNGVTTTWDTLAGGGSAGADADWLINGNDITSMNSGNVGIGTATPARKLHIESTLTGGDGILINANSTGDPGVEFATLGASQFVLGVDQSDNNKFKIGTSALNVNTRFVIDSQGKVGVGLSSPNSQFSVFTIDSIIADFTTSNADFGAVVITNTNPLGDLGLMLLSGTDTAIFGLDPGNKTLIVDNSITGGHIVLNTDSSIVSYAEVIGNIAQGNIYNVADTVFNTTASGNIYNVNSGTFFTDSLYVLGNNVNNAGYVLANDGLGQAKWTDPAALSGASLWQSNASDIYFNTGKVGIGTNSPTSSLTINTVAGADIEFIGGANADIVAPSQLNLSSINSTMIDASDIYLRTSSTDRLTVLNNGNVGIGLSSPSALLDVGPSTNALTIRATNTNATNGVAGFFNNTVAANTNAALFVQVASTTAPVVTLSTLSSTTLRMERTNASAFDWELAANNTGFHIKGGANSTAGGLTDFLNIDGNGNAGLGIVVPVSKFHIHSTSGIGNFRLTGATTGITAGDGFSISNDGSSNVFMQQHEAADWYLITGGTTAMVIKPSTNIGIGTTSPSAKLDLNGTFRLTDGSQGTGKILTSDASGNATWQFPATPTSLWSGSSGVLYPTSITDNVGIGTTTPSQKLDVDGGGSIEVDGDYTYESAKTRTLSIPISALNQKKNENSDPLSYLVHESYVAGYYGESGYCYFKNGNILNVAVATAPVYLPQGAIVTELKVKWFDQSVAYNASLSLESINFGTINNAQMAIVSTTGNSTSVTGMLTSTDVSITSATINNTNNAYYIKMSSQENTALLGFAKIVITYTVTQAD